jgi:hypothetical protein
MRQVAHSEDIQRLAAAMRELPAEQQFEDDPIHLFAPGIYVRVLHMPAGSAIVSKVHKTEHFCLAVTGRATVRIGDHVEEVIGPKLMRTMPGTRRALYIHEDATWITFHPLENADTVADERDLEKIERRLIARDAPDLFSYRLQNADRSRGALEARARA